MVSQQWTPAGLDTEPIYNAIVALMNAFFAADGFIAVFLETLFIDWFWSGFIVGLFETDLFGSSSPARLGWGFFLICLITAGCIAWYSKD
jgi:hypothetical protein